MPPWITTGSGLQYYDSRKNYGVEVSIGQTATVHYIIALTLEGLEDGTWIDNSWTRESAVSFKVGAGEVIKGADEAIQGMRVASERRMIIPPDLGFGNRAVSNRIPQHATLFCEIYLVAVK